LRLHRCLVDCCGPCIACFKDFDAYGIVVNISVEYAATFIVY